MGEYNEKKETCGTICLKYLLFTFNCCFWLAGLFVMAVGIWTLALKSDYISLLASSTYLAIAYILVVAGAVVMVTGILGCCATFKERRNLLRLVVLHPAAHYLPARGHCGHPGLRLLPAAELRAEGHPQGHHGPEVPPARPGGGDHGGGQAAAGVQVLREQQLPGLGRERVDPLGRGRRPQVPRQLLQDRGGGLRPAGPRLQHLQSGGRLHQQTGEVHSGAPEDHWGRGPGHCLCADLRDDFHLLPVQKPQAGALLGPGPAPCQVIAAFLSLFVLKLPPSVTTAWKLLTRAGEAPAPKTNPHWLTQPADSPPQPPRNLRPFPKRDRGQARRQPPTHGEGTGARVDPLSSVPPDLGVGPSLSPG